MLLIVVFVLIFAVFLTSLLLATRPSPETAQLQARFALMRASHPAGLSGVLVGSDAGDASLDLLKMAPVLSRHLLPERLTGLLLPPGMERRLRLLAEQAGRAITPSRLLVRCGGCGGGGLLVAMVVLPGTLLVLPAIGLAAALPIVYLRWLRSRRMAAFEKSLPDLIDRIARCLRAGHSLVAAIGVVAEQSPEPARAEFAEVFRQQNFGLPLRDALLQMLDRIPSNDLRVLVTGILVQKDTGGNLTQILDRTAGLIRERLKLQGDIRVHTAQGRMTGWILCLLPIVMLVLINLINPGYSDALTGSSMGRKLLYAGIALLCVGAYLIRRIVNGIEI